MSTSIVRSKQKARRKAEVERKSRNTKRLNMLRSVSAATTFICGFGSAFAFLTAWENGPSSHSWDTAAKAMSAATIAAFLSYLLIWIHQKKENRLKSQGRRPRPN